MVTVKEIIKYVDDRLDALDINCVHQAKGIRELKLIKEYILHNEQPQVSDEAVAQEENPDENICPHCGRPCKGKIGLKSHLRYCKKKP